MDEMQDKEMNTPLADEPQGGTPGEAEPERPAAAPEEAQKPAPPSLRAHFALDSALRNPAFVRLTAPDVGVPVADAWYALHRREYAETLRRESLEQAAAAVASGSLRPREGGRASGGELLGTDPRHMTAAQRAELRDRIKRGERVYPR